MKSNFIDRVIVSTLIFAIPLGLFCGIKGQAISLGALWGSANLFILKHLILKMLNPEKKDYLSISLLVVLKCVLYASGYLLLGAPSLPMNYLFVGFSIIFMMMALNSLIRLKRA